MEVRSNRRLLLIGSGGGVAAEVAERLIDEDPWIACTPGDLADAVLIDGMDVATETPFTEVQDDALAALVIDATLVRVAALQSALPRVAPSGAIVVIGSDAYLGRWYGAAQAAASAALVGIVRSVAMEYGRSGLRINLLALPLGITRDDRVAIDDAAVQVRALCDIRSMNGQTLVMDHGHNLRFAQSRRRR